MHPVLWFQHRDVSWVAAPSEESDREGKRGPVVSRMKDGAMAIIEPSANLPTLNPPPLSVTDAHMNPRPLGGVDSSQSQKHGSRGAHVRTWRVMRDNQRPVPSRGCIEERIAMRLASPAQALRRKYGMPAPRCALLCHCYFGRLSELVPSSVVYSLLSTSESLSSESHERHQARPTHDVHGAREGGGEDQLAVRTCDDMLHL